MHCTQQAAPVLPPVPWEQEGRPMSLPAPSLLTISGTCISGRGGVHIRTGSCGGQRGPTAESTEGARGEPGAATPWPQPAQDAAPPPSKGAPKLLPECPKQECPGVGPPGDAHDHPPAERAGRNASQGPAEGLLVHPWRATWQALSRPPSPASRRPWEPGWVPRRRRTRRWRRPWARTRGRGKSESRRGKCGGGWVLGG